MINKIYINLPLQQIKHTPRKGIEVKTNKL